MFDKQLFLWNCKTAHSCRFSEPRHPSLSHHQFFYISGRSLCVAMKTSQQWESHSWETTFCYLTGLSPQASAYLTMAGGTEGQVPSWCSSAVMNSVAAKGKMKSDEFFPAERERNIEEARDEQQRSAFLSGKTKVLLLLCLRIFKYSLDASQSPEHTAQTSLYISLFLR